MDRGTAMLAIVLDVYEGGKDLIPGWKLKEHAESALATGGVEGLRRYYEACLTGSDHRGKTTLEGDRRKTLESERERFMAMYLGLPGGEQDDCNRCCCILILQLAQSHWPRAT